MENIKVNFKECDRLYLEDTFALVQVPKHDKLDSWIEKSTSYSISAMENELIIRYQNVLNYRVDDWNEQELIENFIGPLFSLIDFNTLEYGLFSERLLQATIGEYELSGYPDAVIAKGRRVPKIPYFCFHEYKKESEPKGDPAGQCLVAMMAAQALNNNNRPMYGIVVKGLLWSFLVLQGNQYSISNGYKSTDDELWEIVKMLKHLKTIIDEFSRQDSLK